MWYANSGKGFMDQIESLMGIASISFQHCHYDHSRFARYTTFGIVLLVIYTDDILLTGSDTTALR